MKLSIDKFNLKSSFVKLKDEEWLDNLRVAGKTHKEVMAILESFVQDKSDLTLLEMSEFAEKEIRKRDCAPTFLGYKGFPAAVCCSVNEQLVHGIPGNRKLKNGDLITFDFGCTFSKNGKSAIADAARTFIFGEGLLKHKQLIAASRVCFDAAFASIKVDTHIGIIGNAIYKTARNLGFEVISQYGGHSVDYIPNGEGVPHAEPFISNKAHPLDGVRIQPNLCICIEPLLVPYGCSTETKTLDDRWTVLTKDISSHYEDTIYIHENSVENITG